MAKNALSFYVTFFLYATWSKPVVATVCSGKTGNKYTKRRKYL